MYFNLYTYNNNNKNDLDLFARILNQTICTLPKSISLAKQFVT